MASIGQYVKLDQEGQPQKRYVKLDQAITIGNPRSLAVSGVWLDVEDKNYVKREAKFVKKAD